MSNIYNDIDGINDNQIIVTNNYNEVTNPYLFLDNETKKINKEKIAAMSLVMTVVAFLGYWVENIYCAISHGWMSNRNVVFPFLFGYGLAIAAIYLMFGTPKAPRLFKIEIKHKSKLLNFFHYFLIAFLCVCIGEIALGTFVERACDIIWWDYTDLPLNFTKYTSVPTSMGFAFLITLFMGVIFKPLYNFFSRIKSNILIKLAFSFMLIMVLDFIWSSLIMYNTNDFFELWRIEFN